MRKETITNILLQYDTTKLTRRELEFLLSEIVEIKILYNTGGISLKTLGRQRGITPLQVKDIIVNNDAYIRNLQACIKNAPKKSEIFKDSEMLERLLENTDIIVDYFEEGYNRLAVFKSLACIPSNRVWSKFRTILRKQGIQLGQGDDNDGELASNIA